MAVGEGLGEADESLYVRTDRVVGIEHVRGTGCCAHFAFCNRGCLMLHNSALHPQANDFGHFVSFAVWPQAFGRTGNLEHGIQIIDQAVAENYIGGAVEPGELFRVDGGETE
jgi:hypothetical protein